jgi:hypothetical protein
MPARACSNPDSSIHVGDDLRPYFFFFFFLFRACLSFWTYRCTALGNFTYTFHVGSPGTRKHRDSHQLFLQPVHAPGHIPPG